MDNIKLVLFACFIILICLYAIYRGFIFFKQKQVITDTPTSNISTAAIGSSVEVKGRGVSLATEQAIKSPLLGRSCIAYAWDIEEYKSRGKSSKWVKTGMFFSDQYIKVKDKSNRSILVRFDELNLEFWRTKKRVNLKSFFSKPHSGIVDTIQKYPELNSYIRYKQFLGTFRVTEYTVMPFHNVYLLGEAAPTNSLEDISELNLKRVVIGDESKFANYKNTLDDVEFIMKKSEKFGDVLKIKEVFASNYQEGELIKKIALKAYALIILGVFGLSCVVFFLLKYFTIVQSK